MLNNVFDTKNEVNEIVNGPNSAKAYLASIDERILLKSTLADYKTADSTIQQMLYFIKPSLASVKFKKTYTPTMMRLVKKLAEKLQVEIREDLMCENHHVILKAKHKIEDLAEAKMLLAAYEGCPHCLEPDCTSDHA